MKVYAKAKCRNCGEIFIFGKPDEVDLPRDRILKVINKELITEENKCIHECSNGEIGIADGIALILEE